jgi:radical SAM protein (TIGR01212 family)
LTDTREPFRSYSAYLREKYGRRVYRVGVDGGFSCPNRAADGSGGCSYCSRSASRAPYLGKAASISDQVDRGIAFLGRRYCAESFILYFQAFSSTFAPVEKLKARYDEGLSRAEFLELIVSTRPDCVDREKAALLAAYRSPSRDVWVELGLQTASDSVLKRINRGHDAGSFFAAYGTLKDAGLKVAVHLVFGLPGEGGREMAETVGRLAPLRPDGVKIHNLTIPSSSALYAELAAGELTLPCGPRHLDYVVEALEALPAETIVMRLTCDPERDDRAIPRRFPSKQEFYAAVRAKMAREGRRQGSRFRA